jgi:hypothetical protein
VDNRDAASGDRKSLFPRPALARAARNGRGRLSSADLKKWQTLIPATGIPQIE